MVAIRPALQQAIAVLAGLAQSARHQQYHHHQRHDHQQTRQTAIPTGIVSRFSLRHPPILLPPSPVYQLRMNIPALHPQAHLAAAALCDLDPLWRRITATVGPCELPAPRLREPFEALIRAITHQQLHSKAAESILNRFIALFDSADFPSPGQILNTDPGQLRAVGLSSSKIAAILDLCNRSLAGLIPDLCTAQNLTDEELIAALIPTRGIGRWSVEMLLIFGLGRVDVLPVDDFGVREGYRKVMQLAAQPKPKSLAAIGAAWAPWRSFASWYLWQANQFSWNS